MVNRNVETFYVGEVEFTQAQENVRVALQSEENFLSVLKQNVVVVAFKKVDGSDRVMRCTRMAEHLPPMPARPEGYVAKKPADGVTPVYDLDNNGWRSIRFESIVDIYIADSISMTL